MRYGIPLEQGGWVVRDAIIGQAVTPPATSDEAQQAVVEWNARASPDQSTHRSRSTAGGQPVNCGFGCLRRTAGGAWSPVGMGCDGCAQRIFASLGQSSQIIWMINTRRDSVPDRGRRPGSTL